MPDLCCYQVQQVLYTWYITAICLWYSTDNARHAFPTLGNPTRFQLQAAYHLSPQVTCYLFNLKQPQAYLGNFSHLSSFSNLHSFDNLPISLSFTILANICTFQTSQIFTILTILLNCPTAPTLTVLSALFIFPTSLTFAIWTTLPTVPITLVRYDCGGWPEEVNTCLLNSYMVYL